MILGEVPVVVLPKSWVITRSNWPTLLQHLQNTVVITSNVGIYTYLPPPPLFEHPAEEDLKSGINRPTLDFLIHLQGPSFWANLHARRAFLATRVRHMKVFSTKRLPHHGKGSSGEGGKKS